MKRENPLLISAVMLLCTNLLMASVPPTASQLTREQPDTLRVTDQVPAGMRPPHRADAPVAPTEVNEQPDRVIECPPGGIEEQEPCGDDINGGCLLDDPQFEPLACSTTVCGTGWFDGSTRDTDWFEVVLTQSSILTISLNAEFDALFGPMEQYLLGLPGCDNLTGYLEPQGLPGGYEPMTLVTNCLPAGTYYIFVAPRTTFIHLCPTDYVLSVECEPCVVLGACCVDDVCVATNEQPDCDALGGDWFIDETCPEFQCPGPGPFPDFYVTAPYTSPLRDTCGSSDDCALRSGEEHTYEVIIPYESFWKFNTCLDSSWDTHIFLGTEWCTQDLGYNDDSCGLQSEIIVSLEPGTYHCDIEGSSGCGSYIFDVTDAVRGACCYGEGGQTLCVNNHEFECDALGGDYYFGASCVTFCCPGACCSCPESNLYITILTDAWPSETTWEVTDHATGEVMFWHGPYTDDNTLYEDHLCIEYADCVDFTIYDSYGDGIYAPGGYRVILDGVELANTMGGLFTGYEETVEMIGGGCQWPEGACCVGVACVETNTLPECDALGGDHYEGETCPEFECPLYEYCTPCYTDYDDDYITNVTFNTINNDTGPEGPPCSYGDYTGMLTDVDVEETYQLSVSLDGNGSWTQYVSVWFDWDQNGTLETGIQLGSVVITPGTPMTITGDITIPATAVLGTTRMRVMERYSTQTTDPCEEYIYGEAEDYTVVIGGGICGDFDLDGDVDVDDFYVFLDAFGTCAGDEAYEEDCDFDGDECITLVDYQMWTQCYRDANG